MAKEYPYFKFYVNEWISGDISFLSFEEQGLFINLCSYYWSRNGNLSLANAKRKFSEIKPTAFDSLISNKILKLDDNENIKINFLEEQMNERGIMSHINSENGKKGGRPKKPIESENKPTAFFSESELKAKKSNIEEIREDKIRKDKKDNNNKTLMSEIEISDDTDLITKMTFEFWNLFKSNMIELGVANSSLKLAKADKWISEMKRIIEIDKRDMDDIRLIWAFLKLEKPQANGFSWKQNILSISKLREKFEKLLITAKNQTNGKQNGITGYNPDKFDLGEARRTGSWGFEE